MPTSSVKMCISICASAGAFKAVQEHIAHPVSEGRPFRPCEILKGRDIRVSVKRADRMRFRASGRLEPSVVV